MIVCSFVFSPGTYDEEFYALDAQIEAFAQALPGYDHVEKWVAPDGKSKNSMYFFADYAAVRQLAQYPQHLEAKSKVDRWYNWFRIDVFELKTSYGSHTKGAPSN